MRILYATHGYKPAYRLGGPIHSVSAAAEHLVKLGHEVIVFATNSNLDEDLDVPLGKETDVNGVKVWYFKHEEPLKKWLPFIPYMAKSMGFLYAPEMAGALERILPTIDVVHTQMPYVYPTLLAGRAALQHGKPLFYSQRGVFDPERLKFRGFKKRVYIRIAETPIMRRATTLIALTEAEVSNFRALGINTPCRVIPNGVTVPAVDSLSPISDKFRDNILVDDFVILFLARLHPIKGADRLIDAFLHIFKQFPSAKLVMAGPDEWGVAEKFRKRISDAGALGRVLFPGMVAGAEKHELLSRANLFCLPSDAEGFSMAILESLAYSTPVIISPGCHFPEVETANAGVVVSPTPKELAKAMATLIADPDRLRKMGEAGRTFVAKHYSWDSIAGMLAEAYRDAIAGK